MQKAYPQNIAVKVPSPIHYVCFDGRFRCVSLKRRPDTDIANATPPNAIYQTCGDVNTASGYDAVMRPQVCCWKAESPATFRSVHNLPFDPIRPAEHSAREIHFTLGKQVTDPAGAYPQAPQGD